MSASIIDTLRYSRRLTKAGVAPAQAEAMADALAGEFTENLVTKTDLGSAVSKLKAEIKADLAALEARLTWRLLSGVAVIVGLAVALTRFG